MKNTTAIKIVTLAIAISNLAVAQTSAPQSSMSVPADSKAVSSPWGFSYFGNYSRNAVITNTHFKDAGGDDYQSGYATVFDTENHFKLSYKLDNGDKVIFNQRVFWSVLADSAGQQDEEGGGVPFVGFARVEYAHNIGVGNGSSLVGRLSLPSNYDYIHDYNMLAGLAGMANLNWDLNPKVSVAASSFVGAMFFNGSPNALSPWQIDSLRRGYTNDFKQADVAGYMAKTGPQRDYLQFNQSVSGTYNFDDKVSLQQSVGYGLALKDISDNFAHFQRSTAFYSLSTEMDYQYSKALGFAVGASQQMADMAHSSDPSSGKSIYFDGYSFALFRPEETTYYTTVSYTY